MNAKILHTTLHHKFTKNMVIYPVLHLESIISAKMDYKVIMFDQLSPTDYLLLLIVLFLVAFIVIVLLPTLLELRYPKDAGPRKIL